jgi:beta-fructofuranosidase
MLALNDKWLWDFWLAQEGATYHMFYLQANKSLGDPELRHWNVSIGHAKSDDLMHWQVLPDALSPTANNLAAADSYTTWTGCVVRHQNTWYMFYTGTSRIDKGLVQRVCLAQSEDLIHWQKHPANPLAQLNPAWYDGLILEYWHDASFRDPWVFALGEQWNMLVTARANTGAPDGRGAIGHAISDDLIHWQVQKSLLAPGHFGEMEVPQLCFINGHYYLFCSVSAKYHSAAHRAEPNCQPQTGLKYYRADNPLGPFTPEASGFLTDARHSHLYSGRLVLGTDKKTWYFLAFAGYNPDGQFSGCIIDPIEVIVHSDGRLSLAQ